MKPASVEAQVAEYAARQRAAWSRVVEAPMLAMASTPLQLDSRANASRGESRVAAIIKAEGVKAQRLYGRALGMRLVGDARPGASEGRVVLLVRIAPRRLDSDNLVSAFKAVRDGIAKAWRVDDSEAGPVVWLYAQAKGPYGVRVEVYPGCGN